MGYNILQCSNIMWLDGVLILPLVALGIYEYTYKRKTGLYYIALFYAVFTLLIGISGYPLHYSRAQFQRRVLGAFHRNPRIRAECIQYHPPR